jgi:uncharacterized protein (DUF305 family)
MKIRPLLWGAVCLLPFLWGVVASSVVGQAAPVLPTSRYTEADVQFMQGMIHHHAQALEMTRLVPERSRHRGLHLLAERITVSQGDEIAWMQRWLDERNQDVPDPSAHAHHGAEEMPLMPGMLTPDQMARLTAATDTTFDRLFLELMIQHHEGALVMVADLLDTQGALQDSETFRFVADIDVDQRSEIRRMRTLLNNPPR